MPNSKTAGDKKYFVFDPREGTTNDGLQDSARNLCIAYQVTLMTVVLLNCLMYLPSWYFTQSGDAFSVDYLVSMYNLDIKYVVTTLNMFQL